MSESFNISLPADQSRVTASKGIHVATCKKVESKTSSAQNPMLVFLYESNSPGEEGRTVFDNVVITQNMAWRYTKVFAAYGIKPHPKDGFKNLKPGMFVGKKVRLVIEHEDYQGEMRARVREVLPLGDGKSAVQALASVATTDEPSTPDTGIDLGEDAGGNPEDDLPF